MPDFALWPEPLALYLAVINAATFSLLALDRWLCARRGTDEALSRTALTLLMFAGGAAGGVLAFLLLDRHTNKRNSAWHIFSLIALLGWALVLVALYVAPLDPTALRAALGRDHTVLLAFLGAASGVTFLAFVADKLIALWNGRGHDAPRMVFLAVHTVHAHAGHREWEQRQVELRHVARSSGSRLPDNLAKTIVSDHHKDGLAPTDGRGVT